MKADRPRPPWSWAGFVAVILALAVGGGFAVAMFGATIQHEPITQQGAALLNTLGGGLIAVLSLWIGGQAESAKNRHEREIEDMSTTTPNQPDDPSTTRPERPQDPDVVVEPAPEPETDPDVESDDDGPTGQR